MIKRSFEKILYDWIITNGLFDGMDRVLLAVSGGADSVAMVHALINLKQQGHIPCDFVIGHVNHQLRGEHSDNDEHFVKALAQVYSVPVCALTVNVKDTAASKKLSLETAGRTLRLKTLAEIAVTHDCDCIATAHHKDDQAETMIHRLLRGTGFRGLCGILPISQVYGTTFIRPMLNVRRNEIIDYCQSNDVNWREDASNRNLNFTRNRIRHQLIPSLNNDTMIDQLSLLSRKNQLFLSRTKKHVQRILTQGHFNETIDEFVLKQDALHECQPWVFYECMRQVLVKLNVGLRYYSQTHFETIREIANQTQAKADFPGQIEIAVEEGSLLVRKKSKSPATDWEPVILETDRTAIFGPWRISSRILRRSEVDFEQFLKTKDAFIEWFDADKISGTIKIRVRQDGDRFCPVGGHGEKKVARFLQDAQLDTAIKQTVFVAADNESILWVAPLRMAEHPKITTGTRRILEIRIHKRGN